MSGQHAEITYMPASIAATHSTTDVMATGSDAATALLGHVEQQLDLVSHEVVRLPYRDLVLMTHGPRTSRFGG
ncbi:hypothetical protein [Actinoplanes couchii]|uniref:hypothetical protein n=1 Tax=Actinoplanes couchii TaxID=403638 RepID=UPI0019430C60|nr:hypothetical protein [Actinoplanes couchii]